MPYRRRTYRRRYKRRTYRRKWSRKNVTRRFKNDGKRFFKLTTSDEVVSTAGGQIANVYTDNPNGYNDWTQIASLFDSYRVCAIKIKYIPNKPNDESNVTTYQPLYIVQDRDSTTLPSTVNDMIQYENLKVKNLYRPWTYYRKFAKQTSTGVTGQVMLAGGYKDCGQPTGSQAIFIVSEPGLQTSTTYGRWITTLYLTAKNRR